jgi:LysR family nitrogen assimilation transcriptional regulator
MNLKQLEYFVRVAELGSFSKAALVLDVAQPAISRHVRQLETDLRVQLLTRTGRGVALTEAGKRLFDHGINILQLVVRAANDIEATRDEPSGRIVIGLPPSISRHLTLPLVESFQRTLPKVHLVTVEGLSSHLVEWIATGRVDVGLVMNPEPNPSIEITPALDEPLGLVSRAAAAQRQAKALPFSGLCDFPLVLPERTHAIRRRLETQAALSGLKFNIVLEVSSVPSILDLVSAGYGHAILPRIALTTRDTQNIFVFRPLVKPALSTMLCLAVSARKPATPLGQQSARLLQELVATFLRGAPQPP